MPCFPLCSKRSSIHQHELHMHVQAFPEENTRESVPRTGGRTHRRTSMHVTAHLPAP